MFQEKVLLRFYKYFFVLIISTFFLKGCGTTYLMDDKIQTQLSLTKIGYLSERQGHYLRTLLKKQFKYTGKCPEYNLSMRLIQSKRSLGLGKDATTRRFLITLQAVYELSRCCDNYVIDKGGVTAHHSYNILANSLYADTVAERFAKESNVEQLAQLLTLEIGTAFYKHNEKLKKEDKKLCP